MRVAIVLSGVLLVVAATDAAGHAARVVRCQLAGEVIYQDAPCTAEADAQAWRPPPGQARAQPQPRRRTGLPVRAQPRAMPPYRRRPAVRRPIGVLIPLQQDPQGCERAKRQHARLRVRQPQAPLLVQRQWNDALREACR